MKYNELNAGSGAIVAQVLLELEGGSLEHKQTALQHLQKTRLALSRDTRGQLDQRVLLVGAHEP